jgi:hypothetical protein
VEDVTITPAVLTGRQMARYLGYSYSYFRESIQPELPRIQLVPNGRITFLREDGDKWLRKHRRPAPVRAS